MRIDALTSTVTDNFFYLIVDGVDAVLVDPIDASVAIDAARKSGAERVRIFTTHGHPDHIGGNAEVKAALGCEILAPAMAELFPTPHDVGVRDGDVVSIGGTSWSAVYAPGHTDDHLVLHHPGHLISGDVYFVAGAGNCRFGGNAGELHRTFTRRLASLPDNTVFYPGHDYAAKNLAFCSEVDATPGALQQMTDRAAGWSRAQGPMLTTLAQERAYNPFHRTGDARVQDAVAKALVEDVDASIEDRSERTFRALRSFRDRY